MFQEYWKFNRKNRMNNFYNICSNYKDKNRDFLETNLLISYFW